MDGFGIHHQETWEALLLSWNAGLLQVSSVMLSATTVGKCTRDM
jgi:hypothetical protein